MHPFDANVLLIWRVTAAIAVAFTFATLFGRSARTRSALWTAVGACLLALPILSTLFPIGIWSIAMPLPVGLRPQVPAAGFVASLVRGAIPTLQAVWVVGTIGLLVRLIRSLAAARQLVRGAHAIPTETIAARVFTSICCGEKIRRRVRLCMSDAIAIPITSGVFDPCVILPRQAETWSADRLEAVMRHEIAHVVHIDYVTRLGFEIACALYWPNPLVWWAAVKARSEQESGADDAVLAAGCSPSAYADALIAIARASVEGPARLRIAATTPPLKARIAAILDGRTRERASAARRLTTAFGALATGIIPAVATITIAQRGPTVAPAAEAVVIVTSEALTKTDPRPREMFGSVDDALLHTVYYSDRPAERITAARRLASLDRSKATAAFIDLLSDSCHAYRWRAARSLRELADAKALSPLIEKMLDDEHPAVRSMAANAIATLPLSRSAPALRAALLHAPRSTFARAGRALDTLGETPVHAALLEALRDARSASAGSN